MPRIRLLTSVAGGPAEGDAGDVLTVPDSVAAVWADGVRAELVTEVTPRRRVTRRGVAIAEVAGAVDLS